MTAIEQPWIQTGYEVFAQKGPSALKIERLAKVVGKNKSSFYHLFADLEVFTRVLLSYHLTQAKVIADKEADCPDLTRLIDILLEHKVDLLFSRQLRVHRENPEFEACFLRINEISIPGIMPLWTKIIDLRDQSYLAQLVLQLSLENFYLQITEKTLNRPWLETYFDNISYLIRQLKKTNNIPLLDGSV